MDAGEAGEVLFFLDELLEVETGVRGLVGVVTAEAVWSFFVGAGSQNISSSSTDTSCCDVEGVLSDREDLCAICTWRARP